MIDILKDEETKFASEIVCAKDMLRFISKQLLLHPSTNSHVVPEQPKGDFSFPVQKEVAELGHKDLSNTLFQDIIGCNTAKQSLLENIVLPFKLSIESRNEIYRGKYKYCSN
jgi:hypothetical protein